VSLDEALRHYRISAEEFANWRRDYPARETCAMTTRCSPQTLEAVRTALSASMGRTPKEVNEIADTFCRDTIRHALRDLVTTGVATIDGPNGRRRYRLTTTAVVT
jgi:hypothetical protein